MHRGCSTPGGGAGTMGQALATGLQAPIQCIECGICESSGQFYAIRNNRPIAALVDTTHGWKRSRRAQRYLPYFLLASCVGIAVPSVYSRPVPII
jgi:hypothetical protein